MDIWAIVYAIVAGFCTAIEQNINGRLSREVTPSWRRCIISFWAQ